MSAFDKQIKGDHYSKLKIQPMIYSYHNKLDPLQHTIISVGSTASSYLTQYRASKRGRDAMRRTR